LWAAGESQHVAVNHYRTWRAAVEHWPEKHGSEVKPFKRLTYLLDEQGWLFEISNALAKGARSYLDEDGVSGPVMTTGRLERFNRKVGQLTHMHQRNPRAGKNEADWREEELFSDFRERVLYALNVPAEPVVTLEAQIIPEVPVCSCGELLSEPNLQKAIDHQVWDLPLSGARVRLQYQERHYLCPQCAQTSVQSFPRTSGMTPRLLTYLQEQLRGDFNFSTLRRTTGVSKKILETLQENALPVPAQLPENLAALTFKWRRQRRLALFDVTTAAPVTLLAHSDLRQDVTTQELLSFLESPAAGKVKQVWVNDPSWIPSSAARCPEVTFVLDPFSTSQLIKRAATRLQQAFSATLNPGVGRAPIMRKYRSLFIHHPHGDHWRLLDRMDPERHRLYDLRDHLMETYPMVGFGLGRTDSLRLLFDRPMPTTDADLDRWLADTEAEYRQRLQTTTAADQAGLNRAYQALHPLLDHLAPGSRTRQAIVTGARLSPHPVKRQVPKLPKSPGQKKEKAKQQKPAQRQVLNLTSVRRKMQRLSAMSAYQARGELTADWQRLLRATQQWKPHD